jgi:hypothetical protein
MAVRFPRLPRANAMRSQTDDVAKPARLLPERPRAAFGVSQKPFLVTGTHCSFAGHKGVSRYSCLRKNTLDLVHSLLRFFSPAVTSS